MKAEWKYAFEEMEILLDKAGPQPAMELISRLRGPLSESDVWDVIRYAEKVGMIEKSETLFDPRPIGQKWRLVKGFDRSRLEIPA